MDFYNQDNYLLSDIEDLIKNEVEESLHLDYKEARALGKEETKKADITKDVSSFANADGGVIVYGASEEDHKPKETTPIDGKTFTKEWLENVIQQIQPRIDGLKIFPIRIDGDIEKSVYVVQIPRSANAPHMARDHRYYKRINFQSVPMEDYEVKDTYNRVTTPNLVIENCSIYIEEETHDHITYQMPIFPKEKIDMGHFHITIKKQYLAAFWPNLVIDMILYYVGGQEDLAFIPSIGQFIEGRENIINAVKSRVI